MLARFFRQHSFVVLAGVGVLGFALFAYGQTIPVYTDNDAARDLKQGACDTNGPVAGWYEQMDALETLRHPFMQTGLSLVLAAMTVAALIGLFRNSETGRLRSPRSKWIFFVLGTGVIALSWASQMFSLILDQNRGVFPHCADTIVIPMFGLTAFYGALFILCLITAGLLTMFFKPLRVDLWAWPKNQPLRAVLITIPFAFVALVIAFFGVVGAVDSSFIGTPAAIVALYLVEATRSAILGGKTAA